MWVVVVVQSHWFKLSYIANNTSNITGLYTIKPFTPSQEFMLFSKALLKKGINSGISLKITYYLPEFTITMTVFLNLQQEGQKRASDNL